nr:VP1 [Mute swan feces associated ambidensovirus 6]
MPPVKTKNPLVTPDERPGWKEKSVQQKLFAWQQYNRGMNYRGLRPVPFPLGSLTHEEMLKYNKLVVMLTTTPKPNDPLYRAGPSGVTSARPVVRTDIDDDSDLDNFDVDDPPDEHIQVNDPELGITQAPSTSSQIETPPEPMSKRPRTDGSTTGRPLTSVDRSPSTGLGSAESGGFGSDMGPLMTVPRPMSFTNPNSLKFRKVHRFTMKGVPFTPIVEDVVPITLNDILMVTPLATIPWDRPFMYMTSAEYSALPKGAIATHASCKAICRNPQIGFETGSSTTDTATLNHNKHYVHAYGLQDNVIGRDRNITFSATKPMVPTGTTSPDYSALKNAMYGYAQNAALFDSTVPASLMGVDIELKNYYCLYSYSTAYATANPAAYNPGWQSLTEHITEKNMNGAIGTEVFNHSYKFGYAPLTDQLPAITNYPADRITVAVGNDQNVVNVHNIRNLPTLDTDVMTENQRTPTCTFANKPSSYLNPMEKNPLFKKTLTAGHDMPDHQPSIHFGMKPIPKISGTIANSQPTEWTTVNAFIEVVCELDVSFSMPSHMAFADTHHVDERSQMLAIPFSVDPFTPHRFNRVNLTSNE